MAGVLGGPLASNGPTGAGAAAAGNPAAAAPGTSATAADGGGGRDRTGGPRPWARRALAWAAWAVVCGLALVALGRLTHLDDALTWPYSAVNALTPVVYLPAYAALLIGFGLRRNRLAIAATALVALHLFWTAPEAWPGGGPERAPAAGTASPVRLLVSNLRYDNPTAGRLGAQVEDADPDIVVLVEAAPEVLAAVERTGALAGYEYQDRQPREGAFGWAVFSRYPLTDATAPQAGGSPMPRMTVTLDGGRRFTLFPVHTIAPVNDDYAARWRAQMAELRSLASQSSTPLVLAGDFNATRDHRPFRRLLDTGLRDAHDVANAGWGPTWNVASMLPPLLRIDHVLASPEFAVTGYRRGAEIGSDHLPLVVDLALRDPATSAD
ncbi:MAG: endonuclease/exonuclease/phosphatase family protein [Frankia sp.]|nr:endonuclease/exonuclease/phosphatase family protein [Frankia sp.]